jgi:hypothetical protein
VFRKLRSMFGLDDAEYMLSLAGSTALRQLNTPGARLPACVRAWHNLCGHTHAC